MRRPGRHTFARLIATVVVLAGACGDQKLSTPTSPNSQIVSLSRAEEGEEPSDVRQESSGPLASLSIDPSVFRGGESTRGTVTLTEPAPASGMVVALASDDTAATVPASVTLAGGATSVTFSITTKRVAAYVGVRITASAGGGTLTALMRLTPVIALRSLTADPRVQIGGHPITGTATLTAVNTGGDTVVRLESEIEDALVPATITIAQGATSGTFTIQTREVRTATEIWIHGFVGGAKESVQIRLVSGRPVSSGSGGMTLGGKID